MLTVEVAELRQYNQTLFRGFFDRLWPKFLAKHPGEGLENGNLKDIFYLDSVSLFLETFSLGVDEMVQAANLRRPLDLDYVSFDYNDYLDSYQFEDPDTPISNWEKIEGLMFDFFHYLIEHLITPEFLFALSRNLQRVWDQVTPIIGRFNVVGLWYEPYVGANNMWDKGDKLFAVQAGDFQVLHTGEWTGYHTGSVFYELSIDEGWEFYLYNGSLVYAGYGNKLIPRGETVTLCRLNENIIDKLDH